MSTALKRDRVKAGICPCGCEELVLYLRLPPPKGEDPNRYFRFIRCYPDGWDGSQWYSGQVRKHPFTKKLRDALYPKLPPELSLD